MKSLLLLAAIAGVTVLPPTAVKFDLQPVLQVLEEAPVGAWPESRAYRFIWIPPFSSQRIISVRVAETKQGFMLAAKASRSGRVVLRTERQLSPAEWETLNAARQDGFWKYHPQDYPQPFFDGATWVMEGVAADERLRIVQHVPSPGPFVDVCKMMFMFSGIRLQDNEESLGR
jgi:hypothetical protein